LVSRDYVVSGVPVIRGQNMGARWLAGEFAFVTTEKAESLSPNLARPGDLIFTQRGTLGQVSLVPSGPYDSYLVSQSQMKLTVNPEIADPRFYYYVFISPGQQAYVRQHSIQTGVPHINLGILRDTPVPLPSLVEQRTIAEVLGALDDKIELNRRASEVLDAMALTHFKSWFIDFDPVRGHGRGEALPEPLVGLFPKELVQSELGKIPASWAVGALGDVVLLQRGFDLPASQRRTGGVPVVAASGFNGTHDEAKVKGPGVVTGRSGVLGDVYFVHEDFWPLNTTLWVRDYRHATPAFAYYLLRELPLSLFNAGSAVPTLNRNHAHAVRVVIPPMRVIDMFEKLVSPLLERIRTLAAESKALAALRDTLLPKLISGELRIREAERILATAPL
jgi:type I restriction enzyme S subunit